MNWALWTPLRSTVFYDNYTIPGQYWVWIGGVYAYIFLKLAVVGIDAIGESQLSGYAGQYPSVSMIYHQTGLPTARLRVLQLIQKNLLIGDNLVQTTGDESQFHAQALETVDDTGKMLLVNKLDKGVTIEVSDFQKADVEIVDMGTGGNPWRTELVGGMELSPYAVAIITQS
ncbi:hypothetical protein VI817_009163 [Penicillium citrinum]|nr:hypothetical protein VI817_009163 [Penicillium citrinum]